MSSASSLETASLSALGAPSTTALASFNPNPVISRTTLITLTFCPPTSVNSTSNSVFSSAASPAPAPAATTTPAAADTPCSDAADDRHCHAGTTGEIPAGQYPYLYERIF